MDEEEIKRDLLTSASETTKQDKAHSLSALEEDILAALLGRQLYGLQITKAIEQASGGKRKIAVGSLYPTLRRLEGKGFVQSYWEGGDERSGARRRYYRISGKGATALIENQTVRKNLMDMEWQPV